jgi:hypothetical protein
MTRDDRFTPECLAGLVGSGRTSTALVNSGMSAATSRSSPDVIASCMRTAWLWAGTRSSIRLPSTSSRPASSPRSAQTTLRWLRPTASTGARNLSANTSISVKYELPRRTTKSRYR